MSTNGLLQDALLLGALVALVRPLGSYIARVYQGERVLLDRVFGPVERVLYRLLGIGPGDEQDARAWMAATLAFGGAGILVVFLIVVLQGALPWNPRGLPGLSWHLALNTAVSFATNTNWQAYSGEAALSPLSQALGLTVQNFVSAATGMAVLAALVRGFARGSARTLGSFWVDVVRGTLYVLLPLSLVLAVFLASQGVVQTLDASTPVTMIVPSRDADGREIATQDLPLGPVASQVAIKQLGTNGGGYFGANSAHPFENPTPLTSFVEMLAILLLAAALTCTFGRMVGDPRQGRALLAAMLIVFVPLVLAETAAEQAGNPAFAALGVDSRPGPLSAGGNLEGKEVRFGIAGSALWTTATTAASNGSVNAMHDSLTPLGGMVPLALIQLGEVVFGGVGSGLYGMLAFATLAVFVGGLMVGRTPEYLGKKIEAFDIQMASLVVLVPCALILVGTAVGVLTGAGRSGVLNPGPHGFSEILYAFSSAGGNNGSAFGGLDAATTFYDVALAVAMFAGRYGVIVPVLALAGSLVAKKRIPAGPGTLPTGGPMFVGMVVAVIVLVGALTFVPSLALGPVAEHLRMVAPG